MQKINLPANIESIVQAKDFMEVILDEAGCSPKAKFHLELAFDELLSNIAMYAYEGGEGDYTVEVEILENPKRALITITDSGMPYNPLAKADPDITLSAEERQIGGLGIFLVKKYMDDMRYAHENGKNVLTLVKNL